MEGDVKRMREAANNRLTEAGRVTLACPATRRAPHGVFAAILWLTIAACSSDPSTPGTVAPQPPPPATRHSLTVIASPGVTGGPTPGTSTHGKGTRITYSYSPAPGYKNLRVEIDGLVAAAAGQIDISVDRMIRITADTAIALVSQDSTLIRATRDLILSPASGLEGYRVVERLARQVISSSGLAEGRRRLDAVMVEALDSLSETETVAASLVTLADSLARQATSAAAGVRAQGTAEGQIEFRYVNGIWASPAEATTTRTSYVTPAVATAGFSDAQRYPVDDFYNSSWRHTPGNARAFFICLSVAAAMEATGQHTRAGLKVLRCLVRYGPLQDPLEAATQALNVLMGFPSEAKPDAVRLASEVRTRLAAGSGVVLIGHSQGTLMIAEALAELRATATERDQACLGVVAIAPPVKVPVLGAMQPVSDLLIEDTRVKDILLRVGRIINATGGVRRTKNELSIAWESVLVPSSPSDWVVSGIRLHSIEGSYLGMVTSRDILVRAIKEQADSVAARCKPAPPSTGTIESGVQTMGTIRLGAVDRYVFPVEAGDAISASIGRIDARESLWPWIRLVLPSGALIGSALGPDAAHIVDDFGRSLTAPVGGNYSLLVGSWDGSAGGFSGTGRYRLVLSKVPGAQHLAAGDEGGLVANGATVRGMIELGDVDAWTIRASAGDAIFVSSGRVDTSSTLWPWVRLVGPNGATLGVSLGREAAQIADAFGRPVTASLSGDYTVLVGSWDGSNGGYAGTGAYRLSVGVVPGSLVVSTGDEGGDLQSAADNVGTITAGDLDYWTFRASQGEAMVVSGGRLDSTSTLWPWLRLLGPNGELLGSAFGRDAGQVTGPFGQPIPAPRTGTYTVVVGSWDGSNGGYGGAGRYRVSRR